MQENGAPTTEAAPKATSSKTGTPKAGNKSDDDRPATIHESSNEKSNEKHTKVGESGSESGGNKSDRRGRRKSQSQGTVNPQRTKTVPAKNAYMPLASAKSRQPEGTRNMTVETETVSSIPQSALNAGPRDDRSVTGRTDPSGSIRLKPSNETIRPKKERKKPARKAASINQGTGKLQDSRYPLTHSSSLNELHVDSRMSSSGSSSYASDATLRPGLSRPRPSHNTCHYSDAQQALLSLHQRPAQYFRSLSDRFTRKASSKADIFEQRVANAVDEANSSDSDETFVYESNPPESHHRPRHHSRTPSVTSSHSQAEHARGGIRNFGNMLDNHKVAGKRSMKFSSNPYNDGDSPTSQQDGTVRSHHPRHIGRFGRGGNHTSVFDQDSPFTQASKLRNPALNGVRQGSRPSSPRSPQSQHIRPSGGLFSRSKEPSFDFDGEGADDERTPLVGSRTPRSNRNSRRVNSGSVRSTEDYYNMHQQRSRWRRCGGCLVGLVVFIAVILSAVAFLIISNKPMYGFNIKRIENVLASEQEIMLDLLVGAINPNALGITITDMDVNVFAKSKHVGTGEFWREHGHAPPLEVSPVNRRVQRVRQPPQPPAAEFNEDSWLDLSGHWKPTSSIDEGTDPIDDDAGDPQTMLLGRIFHFDQALTFEGSPLKRHIHYSVGELRLMKPGNKTEIGGSERWEKVLQYPFELIIRGVLKYQLPISSRAQTAAIGASVLVHPEDGVDRAGNMRLEKVDHSEEWQWVEWNDLKDDEEEIRVVEVVG